MRFHSVMMLVAAIGSFMPNANAQISCGMPSTFDDPHKVMHDGTRSLFWVRPLEVNADGARNAYHSKDPHGNSGLAIEYAGNGMTISRGGVPLTFELEQRDNSEWLGIYERIKANNWKAPPGYAVDIYGFTRDEENNICTRRGGRLVSSTSLVQYPHLRLCNPRRYVDPLALPGIVVPNRSANERSVRNADPEVAPPFARRRVSRGDLAVVYNPETQLWKGAFVFDTGPRHLLGEGSIRLVMNLREMTRPPVSAVETNSLGIEETYVVLFPKSAKRLGPGSTWTQNKIETLAADHFKAWGGGSIEGALDRLFACAETYKNSTPEK